MLSTTETTHFIDRVFNFFFFPFVVRATRLYAHYLEKPSRSKTWSPQDSALDISFLSTHTPVGKVYLRLNTMVGIPGEREQNSPKRKTAERKFQVHINKQRNQREIFYHKRAK